MSEWKTYKLGDLVTFQRGHDLTKSQMRGGKFPVAGSNGVIGFHNEYTTKAPSITIGRSGNIGNAYFFYIDFWAHNTTLYVKEFKNCDPKFIYYLLQTMNFGGHNSGSAVPSLNRNYIHPIEIQAPSLATQVEIAQILSSLDDKIELLQQMNQTLENIAQAIFKEWFVDFNFPGFDGELVDGLPKGWRMGKLGELVYVQNGFAFKSRDFLNEGKEGVLKIKNISNNVVDIVNMQFISEDVANKIDKRFKVESGDLLIAMTGAEVGKIGIVPQTEKKLWLNQRVGLFKEKKNSTKWFCYLILASSEYQNMLLSSASGSAQPNISASQIEKTEILVPRQDVIEDFGKIINPIFEKILTNHYQIQTLTQTRDTLLPRLMSGKIRLNFD